MSWTDASPARRTAAALVGVEGAAAVATGLGFVVAAIAGQPSDRPTTIVLGVLLALMGAGVLAVGRGVLDARPWSRTPAYLTQFFALVVAYYNRQSMIAAVSIVLVLVVVAAVVALVWAQTDEGG